MAATTTRSTSSGTADDAMSSQSGGSVETNTVMYSGSTTYRVKNVQPDELGALMAIAARYKGRLHRGSGNSPVTTAEDLPAGEHTFTVQLDGAQARNGFAMELKRRFKGRVLEHSGSGDFLTIDGTRVTLELVVPEGVGGQADKKSMQTVVPDDRADEINFIEEPELPTRGRRPAGQLTEPCPFLDSRATRRQRGRRRGGHHEKVALAAPGSGRSDWL